MELTLCVKIIMYMKATFTSHIEKVLSHGYTSETITHPLRKKCYVTSELSGVFHHKLP